MKRVTQLTVLAAVFVLCVVSFECQVLSQFNHEGGASVSFGIDACADGCSVDDNNYTSGELFAADRGSVTRDAPFDSRYATLQFAGEGLVLTPIDDLTSAPQTDTSASLFARASKGDVYGGSVTLFAEPSSGRVTAQGFYEIEDIQLPPPGGPPQVFNAFIYVVVAGSELNTNGGKFDGRGDIAIAKIKIGGQTFQGWATYETGEEFPIENDDKTWDWGASWKDYLGDTYKVGENDVSGVNQLIYAALPLSGRLNAPDLEVSSRVEVYSKASVVQPKAILPTKPRRGVSADPSRIFSPSWT